MTYNNEWILENEFTLIFIPGLYTTVKILNPLMPGGNKKVTLT